MNNKKAFSLVELIVSMSIMTVMLSVVLYNYGGFNDNLAIASSAQEMALAIRQAQTYGINVRENTPSGGQFSYSYGIHINSNTPNSYYIFIDTNNNNRYDSGESVETIDLRNGITISSICDSTTCPAPGGVRMINTLFLRPNPDSRIYFADTGGAILSGPLTYGRIRLVSPKGKYAYVIIESTGQISVQ